MRKERKTDASMIDPAAHIVKVLQRPAGRRFLPEKITPGSVRGER